MSITLPTEIWNRMLQQVAKDGIARLSIPYYDAGHIVEIKTWFRNKKNRSTADVRNSLGRLSYKVEGDQLIVTLTKRYYKMTKLQEVTNNVKH